MQSGKRLAVMLFAHGNERLGAGHIARTAAFAEWLIRDSSFELVSLTWDCPSHLIDAYAPIGQPRPTHGDAAAFVASVAKSHRYFDPLVIVLDTFSPDRSFTQALANLQPAVLAHLNDSCGPCTHFDTVFDSDPIVVPHATTIGQPRFFRGPEFAVLHPEIRCLRPASLPTPSSRQSLIVALDAATHLQLMDLPIALQRFSPQYEVSLLPPPVRHIDNPPGQCAPKRRIPPSLFRASLSAADAVLTQGGNIAFEAMALGVPCILWPHPHCSQHTMALVTSQLAVPIQSNGNVDDVAARLHRLLGSREELDKSANNAFSIVDGLGATRVLRTLAAEDCGTTKGN